MPPPRPYLSAVSAARHTRVHTHTHRSEAVYQHLKSHTHTHTHRSEAVLSTPQITHTHTHTAQRLSINTSNHTHTHTHTAQRLSINTWNHTHTRTHRSEAVYQHLRSKSTDTHSHAQLRGCLTTPEITHSSKAVYQQLRSKHTHTHTHTHLPLWGCLSTPQIKTHRYIHTHTHNSEAAWQHLKSHTDTLLKGCLSTPQIKTHRQTHRSEAVYQHLRSKHTDRHTAQRLSIKGTPPSSFMGALTARPSCSKTRWTEYDRGGGWGGGVLFITPLFTQSPVHKHSITSRKSHVPYRSGLRGAAVIEGIAHRICSILYYFTYPQSGT